MLLLHWGLGLCAAGLAIFLAGCGPASQASAHREDLPATSEVTVVAVVSPAPQVFEREIQLTAEFRAWQQASLHAKVAGYLKQLNVDVGMPVRAGQLIGLIEAPELEAERLEREAAQDLTIAEEVRAAAQINHARAQVEIAKATQERLSAVNRKEPGLVAGQEIDEVQSRLLGATAELQAAEAALVAARQRSAGAKAAVKRIDTMLEYCKITAPFSGIVTRRFADPGNLIQAGTASQSQALPLVQISDLSRLRLATIIPEAAVSQIHVGTPLEIRIPALGRTMPGRFARFTRSVSTSSRTMEGEVDVVNSSGEIVPGMVADVIVRAQTPQRVLALPVEVVTRRGGQSYVMLVQQNGTIDERRIETGIENASHIQVQGGLKAEDRVVTGSKTLLRVGQKVEAKPGSAS